MKHACRIMILFIALACNRKSAVPDNLLPRDKMEAVLWDLMRADLFITNYMVIKEPNLDKKQQGIELYTQILKLHKVSQDQFRTSFQYYRSQPEELKVLMDSLSRRTDTTQLQQSAKTPRYDSISRSATGIVKPDTVKKRVFPIDKME